jgi:hypothetical protein
LSFSFFLLTSGAGAGAGIQAPPDDPVIIKLYETPYDPTGLADVLLAALGFTGVLIVVAIVAAAVFAGVLYWRRSRAE